MKSEFRAVFESGKLTLSGYLDGSFAQMGTLKHAIALALISSDLIEVDALNLSLNTAGAEMWIGIVKQYFKDRNIAYQRSALATILQQSEEYKHPGSIFLE